MPKFPPSSRRPVAGPAALALAGLCLAGLVWWKADSERDAALAHFRAQSAAQAELARIAAERHFLEIYRNVRTIGFLPAVRAIDRHAETLGEEARETIRQIYGNLSTSVAVSEVYLVPADLDPARIDPVTGKPEEPIIMFDQRIAGVGREQVADAPPEEEDAEYAVLAGQMAWLREHRPRASAGLDVPMLGSPAVITCDNTDFIRTRHDPDRMGLVFTVPFYRPGGELGGGVSAIIRTKVIREALVGPGQAIISAGYGVSIVGAGTTDETAPSSAPKTTGTQSGPAFASLQSMAFPDGRNPWSFWVARSWAEFEGSGEVRAIERGRRVALGFTGALTALSIMALAGWRRRRDAADMERLVELADAAVEGLVIHEHGRIVAVNRSLERLVGRDRQELAGAPVEQLFATAPVPQGAVPEGGEHQADLNGPAGPIPVEVVARRDPLPESGRGVMALRDLRDRQSAQREREAHRDLRETCEEFRVLITGLLGEIRDVARSMRDTSGEIGRLSEDASSTAARARLSASQAIAGVGQIGLSTEELTASVAEIEGRVGATTLLIQHGTQMSFGTRAEAERLSEAVGRIASSVGLIRSIAAQTNLLALNATIEAARAGEAGRGFSVVASEVKQLAAQTARATDTIDAQMQEITGTVGAAVMAVQSLAETMRTVDDRSTEIAAAVEEQHAATQEIAGVIADLGRDAQAVLGEIAAAAEAAQRTQNAASAVSGAAGRTIEVTDAVKAAIERFLARALAA